MLRPRAIVPLTPSLAILIQRPGAYIVDPNLCTLVVNQQEADDAGSTEVVVFDGYADRTFQLNDTASLRLAGEAWRRNRNLQVHLVPGPLNEVLPERQPERFADLPLVEISPKT